MSIYKRGEIYWMDRSINGDRYRESLDVTTREEAEEKADLRAAEIRKVAYLPKSTELLSKPLSEAWNAYIRVQQQQVSEGTVATEVFLSKRLISILGKSSLGAIGVEDIVRYREIRLNEVSASTVNQEVALLRRILRRSGVEVQLKPLDTPAMEPQILTSETKNHLFNLAANRPQWRVAYFVSLLAASTTMRSKEIRFLLWEKVEFERGIIRVQRSTTKSAKGERIIPINDTAMVALAGLWELRSESARPDYVTPYTSWRTAWESLRAVAGVPHFHFHGLRHQVITELLEEGVPERTVTEIAGQVNTRTLDHYSHFRLKAKIDAMKKVEFEVKNEMRKVRINETGFPPGSQNGGQEELLERTVS